MTRESPNQSKHHSGSYLKFVSERDNQCVPCRGTLSTGFGNEDTAKLSKDIHNSKKDQYQGARIRWLEIHNKSESGMVTKKQFGDLPETVTVDEKHALVVEEVYGYLWPADLYKSHFKKELPDKSKLVSVKHKGKLVTGVLKNPDDGWMQGVLKLSGLTESCVTRRTEVENSDNVIRENQLEDAFSIHSAELRVEASLDADSGLITMKRKMSSAPKACAGSDDEDASFTAR